MTDDEMLTIGESIAATIIGQVENSASEADVARMSILIAHQLMMLGTFLADDANLDLGAVHHETFARARKWHEQMLAMAAAVPRA